MGLGFLFVETGFESADIFGGGGFAVGEFSDASGELLVYGFGVGELAFLFKESGFGLRERSADFG